MECPPKNKINLCQLTIYVEAVQSMSATRTNIIENDISPFIGSSAKNFLCKQIP